MLLVADASVLLKWFLPPAREAYAERADRLRQAHVDGTITLCVPTLAEYELGNTLSRVKSREDALADMVDLQALELRAETMTGSRLDRAIDLVSRFGVTFCDASYHALAMEMHTMLITADARYRERAGSAGHIQDLSEWALA